MNWTPLDVFWLVLGLVFCIEVLGLLGLVVLIEVLGEVFGLKPWRKD